jgi:hypothetical protein
MAGIQRHKLNRYVLAKQVRSSDSAEGDQCALPVSTTQASLLSEQPSVKYDYFGPVIDSQTTEAACRAVLQCYSGGLASELSAVFTSVMTPSCSMPKLYWHAATFPMYRCIRPALPPCHTDDQVTCTWPLEHGACFA